MTQVQQPGGFWREAGDHLPHHRVWQADWHLTPEEEDFCCCCCGVGSLSGRAATLWGYIGVMVSDGTSGGSWIALSLAYQAVRGFMIHGLERGSK